MRIEAYRMRYENWALISFEEIWKSMPSEWLHILDPSSMRPPRSLKNPDTRCIQKRETMSRWIDTQPLARCRPCCEASAASLLYGAGREAARRRRSSGSSAGAGRPRAASLRRVGAARERRGCRGRLRREGARLQCKRGAEAQRLQPTCQLGGAGGSDAVDAHAELLAHDTSVHEQR